MEEATNATLSKEDNSLTPENITKLEDQFEPLEEDLEHLWASLDKNGTHIIINIENKNLFFTKLNKLFFWAHEASVV